LIFTGKYGIDVVIVVRRYMARILLSYILVSVLAYASNAYGYSGGSGSSDAPYLISTPEDWQMLCNSPNDVNANNYFALTNDLNLSGFTVTEVGTISQPFTGSFDGRGYKISGLDMNTSSSNYYCGLFGYIGPAGSIHDLNLNAPSVSVGDMVGCLAGYNGGIITRCSINAPSISSGDVIGGLVGYNDGTIRRCSVTGGTYNNVGPRWISGSVGYNKGIVIDSSFAGDVTLNSHYYAGGLVGENQGGIIAFCSAQGNLNINSQSGGLLLSDNWGRISHCSATGSVTVNVNECPTICGGLASENVGIIDSSYANVSAKGYSISKSRTWVGGLVGMNWRGGIIKNSYATGDVKAYLYYGSNVCDAGGLVGNTDLGIIHCYSTGKVTSSYAAQTNLGGLVGELYEAGTINDSFWDVNTSGLSASAAGVGLTTAQMKTYSPFASAGWDFTNEIANDINDNWRMCVEGVDYPKLAWQYSSTGDFACTAGIDMTDLEYMMDNWLQTSCPESFPCEMADMDHSGLVDFEDFALFAQNWVK
jgi:hypothetical protein